MFQAIDPIEPHLPVLVIGFNRPELLWKVFSALEELEGIRLYGAVDGPRRGFSGDKVNCAKCRSILESSSSFNVRTRFLDSNAGCKRGVAGAIDWFFEHEESGVILEDDCVPTPEFLRFCRQMLQRYQDDESVFAVCGNNFQNGKKRGDGSYYFSKYAHIWGWATWRRAWQKNDVNMGFWPELRASEQWKKLHPKQREREHWEQLLDRVAAGEIDTWDYQWLASIWAHGGKSIIPNKNLVTNVGFGADATHTTDVVSPFAKLPTQVLGEIIHPSSEAVCDAADRYVFSRNYCPDLWQRLQRKWRKLLNRT